MALTFNRPIVTLAASVPGLTAPDGAILGFAGISGTTVSTANAVLTTTQERHLLDITNTTNVDLYLVVSGVGTNLLFAAGTSRQYDLQIALTRIDGGALLAVYSRTVAPASGEVRIQLI